MGENPLRLRIVHLLTQPDDERESRSIVDVRKVAAAAGIEYVGLINPVWTEDFPPPRQADDRPFTLTKAHFGCMMAHRKAFEYLTDEVDAILIAECDCIFVENAEQVAKRFERACQACVEGNLDVMTFGYKHSGKTIDRVGDDVIVITQLIETHAVFLPRKSKQLAEELFSLKDWDCADYNWTVKGYDQRKIRIGTFADRPVAVQASGVSLIDNKMKSSEHHYRAVKY